MITDFGLTKLGLVGQTNHYESDEGDDEIHSHPFTICGGLWRKTG